jgi:hypothetical protein
VRRTLLLVTSMAAVLVLASAVAFAVISNANGGSIQQVRIARSDEASTSSSTSFVDIPGAAVNVRVPSGSTRLILARYSAESACFGSSGWCSVRIVAVKGGVTKELAPASGSDFAFDSSNANNETGSSWESHSMDRSDRLSAGLYTIKAQRLVTNSSLSFRLDDWSLTVERAR